MDNFAAGIKAVLNNNFGEWTGIATDLRAELLEVRPELDLPAGGVWVGRLLRRALPELHVAGVSVTFSRTPEERTITLALRERADLAAAAEIQRRRARQEAAPGPRPHPLRGVRW